MRDYFTREFRLTFAGTLLAHLREPRAIRSGPLQPNYHEALRAPSAVIIVTGHLPLRQHGETGETLVELELTVGEDWMNTLPSASTSASFVRPEIDWHVPSRSRLCYALGAEWRWKLDELWNSDAGSDQIIAAASAWCIRNVDSLITRHLHGHRYGITKWPKEWGQWSHGMDGVREFEEFSQNLKAA